MAQPSTPPGWYPDPSTNGQLLRYYDGKQWTQHTQQHTQQPAPRQAAAPSLEQIAELQVSRGDDPGRIQHQVQQQAGVGPVAGGGGSLFSEPILVVNQKTKLIELNNEYKVFNQQGQPIGSVVQVGQSGLKKAVRFLTSYDQFMTHKLEIRDAHDRPVLRLTRPAKVFKSRFIIERADGGQIGEIKQENVFGKIRFAFLVNGQQVGSMNAENWRAWNFAISDHTGAEVARITKTWEGLLKTMFTTADNYVVQIHRPLADPLMSMVVASALTVDTALKQDNRGWG